MKKSLVIALALMLVLAFASSAMAAQSFVPSSTEDYEIDYLSTTATGMSRTGDSTGSAFSRTYQSSKFTVDGYTYYPYEIYLPNEARPDNYRIHSNYAKNTDACASCHSTHTAVGESLLQWYSVYETCMACHDGTVTTTYDVASGKIGTSGKAAMGGAFNGTGQNSSNHNVTGSMSIAAAPGGSITEEEVTLNTVGSTTQKRWTPTFGCESCHTPHGNGGNARILHPDANFTATANKVETGYAVNGSNQVVDAAGNPIYILKGYPYTITYKNNSVAVTNASISNATGVSVVSGTVDVVYGTPALQVKMTIGNYLGFNGNETVRHDAGMNAFCGACHTDYNTESIAQPSDNASGTYSQAHRHKVGIAPTYNDAASLAKASMVLEDSVLECLTCHVAHGVSDQYWINTIGSASTTVGYLSASGAYLTDDKLVELAGSSALKRIPNMGTCEACHQKGASAEGYNASSGFLGYSEDDDIRNGLMPNTYNWDARTVNYSAYDLGWVGNAKCLPCHEEYVKGWEATTHATSSHTGATGCGRCHNPGNSIMGSVGTFATPAVAGTDAGITCESCHGTAKNHIVAPSTKNIFNPGTESIERQAIECGRCHDMFVNTVADVFTTLSATSGLGHTSVKSLKTSAIESLAGWSVGFRVYRDDPTKFADATQWNTTSNHYGGAWGYADSKHFLGTGTATAPNGVVSCNTCHDMHSDKHAGLLKYDYQQICASCHDASASLSLDVAMPSNNWNRHQIHANDNAHSFKFGTPATIAAVDIETVNLEAAITAAGGLLERTTPAVTTVYSVWDAAYATADSTTNNNMWRGSQTGGAGMGKRIKAYSDAGKTTRVYNNYAMDWEIVSHPAGVVEDVDFEMVHEGGALEFTNPATALGLTAADATTNALTSGGAYDKFSGDYVLKYTNRAFPAITGNVTFTVKKTPLID